MPLQTHRLPIVAAKLQVIIGAATFADLDTAEVTFSQLIDELPGGSADRERVMLSGLLLRFAQRCGPALHARVCQRTRREPCTLDERELLIQFLSSPSDDPCEAFRLWKCAFVSELHRHHPSSAARQAARLLQQSFRRPLNVTALARQVHTTPAQLRRCFKREFGMHLREYLAAVRLAAGLERLMEDKAEATALEVGYSSKKNFYRLVKKFTSLTPTEFRRHPEERRRNLIEAAKDRLKWPSES